ncbi:MAG TPA: hypothetical protein VK049_09360 [Paenalcaligenes sp.]|nr:hypothetical protein [Paenalcaligenes sp.]
MDDELKKRLSQSDAEFIRVLEDLIDTLIARGVIRLTDLPPQALEKLQERKLTREQLRHGLNLIDEDDDLPL